MSTIVSDQLISELSQEINVFRPIESVSLRVKVYFHNSPQGNFFLRLYDDQEIILEHQFASQSIKDLLSIEDDYFWTDLAFPQRVILDKKTYLLKLESESYNFNESSWIGLMKDWNSPYGFIPEQDFSQYPYSFRIIESGPREF